MLRCFRTRCTVSYDLNVSCVVHALYAVALAVAVCAVPCLWCCVYRVALCTCTCVHTLMRGMCGVDSACSSQILIETIYSGTITNQGP